MDNVIDLIATGAKPSDVTDAIKGVLYAKAAERIDAARPIVASNLFDGEEYSNQYDDEEGETEIEQEPQEDQE
jgi:hypothetical protein